MLEGTSVYQWWQYGIVRKDLNMKVGELDMNFSHEFNIVDSNLFIWLHLQVVKYNSSISNKIR